MKIVTAAIIIKDNKVLIARRAAGEKLEGLWEFPGGKLEKGETLQECLERELKEELGITTKIGRELISTIYQYDHGEFKIVALDSIILSGKIKLTVHDKIKWVEINSLLEMNLLNADKAIAQFLIKNKTDTACP